jgi:hypothetical protein
MALPSGTAGVFDPLNVTGVLLNKTDIRTPLFNMLGGVSVGAREFLTGSEYELGSASQPAISEDVSLTAPTPTFTERTQAKNVTQMFHRSVAITYRKESNGQALSGLNNEGLANNVPSEKAFQIANRVAEIRNDIEYTIINGAYSLATTSATVDKTRGLLEAISTNTTAAGNAELSPAMLIAVARQIALTSPYGLSGVVGILNAEQIVQLNKIILNEGQRSSMADAGSNLLTYLTPFGRLNFLEGGHRHMPNGSAVFANLGVCRNVLQPVPGKGNFFYEELAKTGAAETGQIFGQWGFDHSHEWVHAKITGLKTTTAASTGLPVEITNPSNRPVYVADIS